MSTIHVLCDGLILQQVDSFLLKFVWPFFPAVIGGVIAAVIARWLILRLFEKKEYEDLLLLKALKTGDVRKDKTGALNLLYGGQVIKRAPKPRWWY